MATNAIIRSVGSVSGAGTDGVSRNNLEIGETVTLSDTVAENAGSTYIWALTDVPIGSATVLVNPTTATPTFIPDVTGSYFVTCTVASRHSSTLIAAVPLDNTGARIPAFEEKLEYNGGGNTKGWHETLTNFMRQTDVELGGVVDVKTKVTTNDTTPDFLQSKVAAGTGISLSVLNPSGNEQLQITSTVADTKVKVATTDTTTGFLSDKLVAGTGITFNVLNPSGNEQIQVVGKAAVDTVRLGDATSHGSATPLVVSQISFNPTLYGTPTLKFRAVAAMGNTPLTGHAELYNISDSESVSILNFTTTTATLAEAALTIGSGAGKIKTSAKIYEARIYVDTPALPIDLINVGSAEIQVVV